MEHTLEIRVRYHETDGQGRVHHAQYLNYFERGRVELLRSLGQSYKEFERSGLMLVVTEMNIRYTGAAEFDDLLLLTTTVTKSRGVRIDHTYKIVRLDSAEVNSERTASSMFGIVEATSTIACVDRAGKVHRLPDSMRIPLSH